MSSAPNRQVRISKNAEALPDDVRQKTSSSKLVLLTTALAPISWGTTYIAVTEFLPPGRPLTLAALRVLPAGLALATIGYLRSGWRPRGAEWKNAATIAVFSFALFFPLLIVSTYRMPGGVAAAAGGLQPLLVAIFTALLTRKRPSAREVWIGVVAAFGVMLVVGGPGAGLDAIGIGAAVTATVSFSLGVVLTKRFPTPLDRIAATGWQLTLSAILLVPLAWLVEGPLTGLDPRHIGAFAYLSLVTTGIAFVLWFSGIRRLPSAAPPLLGLAAPITGAALGWLILDETLTLLQIAGLVITITAIVTGVRLRASDTTPHREDRPRHPNVTSRAA